MQLTLLNELLDEYGKILDGKGVKEITLECGADDTLTNLFTQMSREEAWKVIIFLNQELLLSFGNDDSVVWDHALASIAFHYGWLDWVEIVLRRRNSLTLVTFPSLSMLFHHPPACLISGSAMNLLLYPNELVLISGTCLKDKKLIGSHRKVADIIDFMELVKLNQLPLSLLENMVQRGWALADISSLPLMWRLPLKSTLLECKLNPPPNASSGKIYHLIGRPDVALNLSVDNGINGENDILIQSKASYQPLEDMNEFFHAIQSNAGNEKKDLLWFDLYGKDPVVQSRFPKDRRIEEVQRMLFSNNPIVLRSNENEPEANQQVFQTTQMVYLSKRTFSQVFGRALLTFGAESRTRTNLGAVRYTTPPLNVSAVFLPFKTPVNLNSYEGVSQPNNNNTNNNNNGANGNASPTHGLPMDYFQWPEFHHGVALAFQIPSGKGLDEIDASWIQSHKPFSELSTSVIASGASSTWATHAGFVYGLGLLGYLDCFSTVDIYQYLLLNLEIMSISVLLGCCVGKRGSMDQKLSRLCSIHVSSLLPPLSDLPTANFLTTAAMLGLGFLYQGTCHRRMAEVMLFEVSRQDLFGMLILPASTPAAAQSSSEPGNGSSILASDPCQSFRGFSEWYALSAGFALGLITLGKGSQAAGLSDLALEDQLRKCIHGTQDFGGWSSSAFVQKNSGARTGGFGYPGTYPNDPSNGLFHQNYSQHNPNFNAQYSDGHGAGRRVRSHGILNTDVSGPAAIAALTLMNLASNNRKAAKILYLPNTAYGISLLKPDTVLLLSFCRPLIEWNIMIQGNLSSWLQSQIPPYIKSYMRKDAEYKFGLDDKKRLSMSYLLIQSYYSMLAGLSLALGLGFVGCNDEQASNILFVIEHELKNELEKQQQRRNAPLLLSYSQRITLALLQKCLGLNVLAQCLVKAGTGDLRLLTWLRQQHGNWGRETSYGLQVMNHMSMGFLFVGGALGSFHLSRDSKNWLNSRAYLFMSVWPVFPSSPQDNQYHFQALRHLWSLSCTVDPVIARDSEDPMKLIPATLRFSDKFNGSACTPCPPPSSKSVLFEAPGYWPLTLSPQRNNVFLLRKTEIDTDEVLVNRLLKLVENPDKPLLEPYQLLELVSFIEMENSRTLESLVSLVRYKLQRLSESWYSCCHASIRSLLLCLTNKPSKSAWLTTVHQLYHSDPRIPLLFTYHRMPSFSRLESCLKEFSLNNDPFQRRQEANLYLDLITNHGMTPKQADLISAALSSSSTI